jgi:sugar/nucleoside kinase (ribokinase family)
MLGGEDRLKDRIKSPSGLANQHHDHDIPLAMIVMLIKAALLAAATIHHRTIDLHAHTAPLSPAEKTPNMDPGNIICAGLSCLDLQLVGCTQSGSDEAIERYDEAVHCAGGSASMSGTTLALLLRSTDDQGQYAAEKVHILTKIGPDFAGNTLLEFYQRAGASTDLVLTDSAARTSMAILPVYKSGKRGCFVNLACNDGFTADELLMQVDHASETIGRNTRAFLFGYPHLMPKIQGGELMSMLRNVRRRLCPESGCVLVGVDLNGVDGSDPLAAREVLIPALSEIDVLHLNEDEAMVLCSADCKFNGGDVTPNDVRPELLSQISSFHKLGCAVVLLSLGSKGAFVSVTKDSQRLKQLSSTFSESFPMAMSGWKPGSQVRIPAFQISHGEVNANGAGDALFSGFCLAASSWGRAIEERLSRGLGEEWRVTPQVAGTFASLVAWQRCDVKTRDGSGMKRAVELMKLIRDGCLPDTLEDIDTPNK